MLVALTLRDLERRDARDQTFPVDLCNYARAVLARTKKPHVVRGVFPRKHPRLPKGPSVPKTTYAHMVWYTETKFGMITRGEDVCFMGSAMLPKCFGTRKDLWKKEGGIKVVRQQL